MTYKVGIEMSALCGEAIGGIPTVIRQTVKELLLDPGPCTFYQCYKFSRLKKHRTLFPATDSFKRIYFGRHLTFPLKKLDLLHGPAEWLPPYFTSIPRVMTIHDMRHINSDTDIAPCSRDQYVSIIDPTVNLVTDSFFIRQQLLERIRDIDPARVHVIHLASDASFKPDPSIERTNTLLFVGTIARNKNILGLIRAFAASLDDLPDASLIICGGIGESDYFKEIMHYINERPLMAKRIQFKHSLKDSEILKLYRQARISILPSFYEGFGIPVIEAQACGCPMILARCASLPEIAQDSALYCDPHNDKSLSAALVNLYNSNALLSDLSQKGIENSKRFSWKKTAEAYKSLYTSILQQA